MGWRKAIMLAVLGGLGTGCPEEWRKGGIMDRAAAKDTRENMPESECPEGQAAQWDCPPDDPDPAKCGWVCR
jgi:hypothetical protein